MRSQIETSLRPAHHRRRNLLQRLFVMDNQKFNALRIPPGRSSTGEIQQLFKRFPRNRPVEKTAYRTPRPQKISGLLLRRQLLRIEQLLPRTRRPRVVNRIRRAHRYAMAALNALVLPDLRPLVPHLKYTGRTIGNALAAPHALPRINRDECFTHNPLSLRFPSITNRARPNVTIPEDIEKVNPPSPLLM